MAKTQAFGIFLLVLVARVAAAQPEVVDLIPSDPPGWTVERLFAPISGLFRGGPSFWYADRTLEIETLPARANLDLFYVRDTIQRRFERARAPILLRLPARIDTDRRDSVEIRATLDGYRHAVVQVEARTREVQLVIELAPLPNRLEAMTHTHLSRRGSFKFLTSEAARFRVNEMSDGFSIAVTGTSVSEGVFESMQGLSSDNVEALRAEQLGEDLVVRVRLRDAAREAVELRTTQGFDAARELHWFTVELVPNEGNAAILTRTVAALDRVQASHVFGCALDFDDSMRSQLDPEALSRALAPSSSFLDRHLLEALRRLGELSPDGLIRLVDGTQYRPSLPLDLAAANAQSAEIIGYLSLLRALVAELEPAELRRSTLRSVIAPELDSARFDRLVEHAEDLERRCGARAANTRSSYRPGRRGSIPTLGRRKARGAL